MRDLKPPECVWFQCNKCNGVWYVLDNLSPRNTFFDLRKPVRKKCPKCSSPDIQKLDIRNILSSWVNKGTSSTAIFGAEGYYKDGNPCFYNLAWESYFEKELVNFDGSFKRVVSRLANASQDVQFRLMPEICKCEEGSKGTRSSRFEIYYPFIQEATKQVIPKTNIQRLIGFLRFEGAIREDRIAFNFCPNCGSKNKLNFRMEERGCEVCSINEDRPCNDCAQYDVESKECILGYSIGTEECCFISLDGDCDGPKVLEVNCSDCGEEYADAFVELKNNRKEIDAITNPEECECLAIRYKPIYGILNKLNQGFTFQEMIVDKIENQGWRTLSGRKRGKSGVDQDVDIFCEKDTKRILVECKRIGSTKSLPLDVVLNLFARMSDLEIKKGVIVTTVQDISNEAKMFAEYYGIIILYISDFLKLDLDSIFN